MDNKKLKILFVASEADPFIKTGGLADVAGSLPQALKEEGHDVRVVIPQYRQIPEKYKVLSVITIGYPDESKAGNEINSLKNMSIHKEVYNK